jgi:hypothetical protein
LVKCKLSKNFLEPNFSRKSGHILIPSRNTVSKIGHV